MSHKATVALADGQVVVEHADDEIWITPEVVDAARAQERVRYPGDIEIQGDLIQFGTPGLGLGRLTYAIVGKLDPGSLIVARRIHAEGAPDATLDE